MKTINQIPCVIAVCFSLFNLFPASSLLAADAARVEGDLKVNGIHFSDSSTMYTSNGMLKDKGTHDSGVAYSAGDVVQLSGSSYVCIAAHTGVIPPNKNYWAVLAAQGLQGPAGTDGIVAVPLSLSGSVYSSGIINTTNSDLNGSGIRGYANSTTGANHGVRGFSYSNAGTGVQGDATATTGFTYGVQGTSYSSSGTGVYGYAPDATGSNYGVRGTSDSTLGKGIFGHATATTGATYGVYGTANSVSGTGVYGFVGSATGTTIGVTGYSNSITGTGVKGVGGNYGIYGTADNSNGLGVYGSGLKTTTPNSGVYGNSYSTSGMGVRGVALATTGTNFGVYGSTFSPSGYAGYFDGNVHVLGSYSAAGTKSFVQPHPEDPSREIIYISIEAPEAMVVHRGTARLESGKATIELPDYFRLVAYEQGIGVQITPRSLSSKGLAAYEVSRDRIKVGELMDGTGSYEFDYIVTGKRDGFEGHEPIQANKHFSAEGLSQADYEKQHSGHNTASKATRNLLIKNGTLHSDGKLNKETARRLNWKLEESESDKQEPVKQE